MGLRLGAQLDTPEQITVGAVIDTPMPAVDPTTPNTRRNAPASDQAPVAATFPNDQLVIHTDQPRNVTLRRPAAARIAADQCTRSPTRNAYAPGGCAER
ncbi:hypothetical protein COUCH_24635 [Couchioplanes caeruleus]|uniref:hypothetical protein n=1 Tax=Couchioplanes caeruleus TaxID=56438 RepID=UPI0020C0BBBF|nr:hypothetical protein [Couchioplanes caeruleus]UQU62216.1 hypothetical protein COUCH_24635 [Couchioplanes caeruleus]